MIDNFIFNMYIVSCHILVVNDETKKICNYKPQTFLLVDFIYLMLKQLKEK